MSFLRKFCSECWMFIIPICLVGIGSITLFFLGYRDVAVMASQLGTICCVLGWLAHTVFVDSKKRWPEDHWFVRFHKIVTFSKR
jgi:energy-converting hydrogenase Eha subunit C